MRIYVIDTRSKLSILRTEACCIKWITINHSFCIHAGVIESIIQNEIIPRL